MTTLLALYLETGLVLFVGGLAVAALVRWGGDLVAAAPRRWLGFTLGLLALGLALPVVVAVGDLPPPRQPAVSVWTGPRAPVGQAWQPISVAWSRRPQASVPAGLRLERKALTGLLCLIAAGGAVSAWRLARARRRLVRLCQGLPVVRRHGRVRLCASDQAPAPYRRPRGGRRVHRRADRAADRPFPPAPGAGPRGRAPPPRRSAGRRGDRAGAGLFFWNPAVGLLGAGGRRAAGSRLRPARARTPPDERPRLRPLSALGRRDRGGNPLSAARDPGHGGLVRSQLAKEDPDAHPNQLPSPAAPAASSSGSSARPCSWGPPGPSRAASPSAR